MIQLPPSLPMREGWRHEPPRQWRRYADAVTAAGGADPDLAPLAVVELTAAREAELFAACRAIGAYPYVPDRAGDDWTPAGPEGGDCESLSLALRDRLAAAGWPAGCLRLLTCLRGGAGHAVLRVVTDKGDYIWCCFVKMPVPWGQLSDPDLRHTYHWGACWAGPAWVEIWQRP